MTTSQPLLMSLDGIDGCGKSSQSQRVVEALESVGVSAEAARVQAFGARTVYTLAENLTGDPYAYHPLIPAELREWGFACDVAYYTRTQFVSRLNAGTTLVWDRGPLTYRTSAKTYDGFTPWVKRVHDLYPRPRTSYLLDLPAEVAVKRLARRANQPRQSDESLELLRRLRAALLEAATQAEDVVLLDATMPAAALTAVIVEHWQAQAKKCQE